MSAETYEIIQRPEGLLFRASGCYFEVNGVLFERRPRAYVIPDRGGPEELPNAAIRHLLAERDQLRARVAELERALSDVGSVARNLRGCVDDELKSLRARIAELAPADSATISPSS